MKLVYINDKISSVFDSQVLALLKYYVENNYFDEVILLFGYQNKSEIDWLKRKDTEGISIYYYKTYPNYPLLSGLTKISLKRILKKISKDFTDYFFHIRGEMPSNPFKQIQKKMQIRPDQLLTDVRGVRIEEIMEFSEYVGIVKLLKLYNYRKAFNNLQKDFNISVVSPALKKHIKSMIDIKGNSIHVTPCLVDEGFVFNEKARTKVRSLLKIKENDILLIFTSGGTAKWQNNEMILNLANMDFKVLNLSRQEVQHPNVLNYFVPYKEVPDYLSAADIAFIWRDRSLVNAVASPVKVSEYLACGLPIIHNGTVGLIDDVTTDGKDAIRINNIGELNYQMISQIISKNDRLALSNYGQSIFGISHIAESYRAIYQKSRQYSES